MANLWISSVLLCLILSGSTAAQTTDHEKPVSTDSPDPSQVFPSMCQIFDAVAASVAPPNFCEAIDDCKMLSCLLDFFQTGIPEYSFTLTFLPCSQPPSFRVRVVDDFLGTIAYEGLISESQIVFPDDLFGTPLNFTVKSLEIGVEFELSTEVLLESGKNETLQVAVLLPPAVYPIDLSSCPSQTCDVITALASGETQQNCTISPRCDGILCTVAPLADSPELKFDLSAKIIPCHEPPAVQLIIADSVNSGPPFANEILTNGSVVTVFGEPIFVTVDQFTGGLGVRVEVNQQDEFTGDLVRSSLLDYSYFPVSKESQNCEVYSLTCLAFQTVVDQASRSNITCETTDACDGVNCFLDVLDNGALFEATTSLTCHSEMSAFDLTLREPSENGKQGNIFIERTIYKDTTVGILIYDIDVKLTRIPEKSALGLEIMLKKSNAAESDADHGDPVIRYTEIPVDEDALCSSFTGSGTTTKLSVSVLLMMALSLLCLP